MKFTNSVDIELRGASSKDIVNFYVRSSKMKECH